jgi:hypothetical protein
VGVDSFWQVLNKPLLEVELLTFKETLLTFGIQQFNQMVNLVLKEEVEVLVVQLL